MQARFKLDVISSDECEVIVRATLPVQGFLHSYTSHFASQCCAGRETERREVPPQLMRAMNEAAQTRPVGPCGLVDVETLAS